MLIELNPCVSRCFLFGWFDCVVFIFFNFKANILRQFWEKSASAAYCILEGAKNALTKQGYEEVRRVLS